MLNKIKIITQSAIKPLNDRIEKYKKVNNFLIIHKHSVTLNDYEINENKVIDSIIEKYKKFVQSSQVNNLFCLVDRAVILFSNDIKETVTINNITFNNIDCYNKAFKKLYPGYYLIISKRDFIKDYDVIFYMEKLTLPKITSNDITEEYFPKINNVVCFDLDKFITKKLENHLLIKKYPLLYYNHYIKNIVEAYKPNAELELLYKETISLEWIEE